MLDALNYKCHLIHWILQLQNFGLVFVMVFVFFVKNSFCSFIFFWISLNCLSEISHSLLSFFNTAIVNGLWARLSSDVYCLLVCFPRDPRFVMGRTTWLLSPLVAKFISFFFFSWSHNLSNWLRSSVLFFRSWCHSSSLWFPSPNAVDHFSEST